MNWNKRTYAKELKKGYWDLEPHYHYWDLIEFISLFETFNKNKMNFKEVNSALYGEFVRKGKPIKKEFYNNFNLIDKIVDKIIKENIKQIKKKNE